MPQSYHFSTVPDIIVASGCIERLTEHINKQAFRSVFIVSDNDLAQLGIIEPLTSLLEQANIAYTLFTDVEQDPSDTTVINATQSCINNQCDVVIGFGGGSPMDVAKLAAVFANCSDIPVQQQLQASYGVDNINCKRLPLIQIPTTAGTGSEATMVAIITTGKTTKSGIVSRTLLADVILLDPLLTLSLPPNTTAYTGIDAMVHAIEAYTSLRLKNPISDMLAMQSLCLLSSNIISAVEDGSHVEARQQMLLGAMMAGQAFANSPVGGIHALAYPLGGIYHIPHGLSNALVLPAVLRYNGRHSSSAELQYSQLLPCLNIRPSTKASSAMANYFEQLSTRFNIKTKLSQFDIGATDIEHLTESALLQQRLLINNPVILDNDAISNIYQQIL